LRPARAPISIPGMTARPHDEVVITLLTPEGEPGARVRTRPDGGVEAEVLDERSRPRAERVVEHLTRARPPRSRPGCVDAGPSGGP
jgi:hypothetical protein